MHAFSHWFKVYRSRMTVLKLHGQSIPAPGACTAERFVCVFTYSLFRPHLPVSLPPTSIHLISFPRLPFFLTPPWTVRKTLASSFNASAAHASPVTLATCCTHTHATTKACAYRCTHTGTTQYTIMQKYRCGSLRLFKLIWTESIQSYSNKCTISCFKWIHSQISKREKIPNTYQIMHTSSSQL